jgi:hypothetical protein
LNQTPENCSFGVGIYDLRTHRWPSLVIPQFQFKCAARLLESMDQGKA